MTARDFRWTLKWHGDLVRQLTLLEVAWREEDRRARADRRRTKRR